MTRVTIEEIQKDVPGHVFLWFILTTDEASVAQLAKLPPLHRDPFDRMLVAQAKRHDLTIATVDPLVQRYGVPVLS